MSTDALTALKERMGKVYDVNAAIGLMGWDQEVYMPPKAAAARGQQLATLSGIAHSMFTDPAVGELIEELSNAGTLDEDSTRLVAETRHDYERAAKLPADFVQRFAEARSQAYDIWLRAKKAGDFPLFKPQLRKIVDLCREQADLLGYGDSPYDALLDEFERGMTVARLRPMFDELATRQSALVDRIMASSNAPDVAWLDRAWDPDKQWDFTLRVLRDMGYDFEAGRQDRAEHPFTTEFDLHDVRITTHIYPDDLFAGMMASIHEGGHALYEQGFREGDRRTVLGQSVSLGIHESQSRMWENLIGQSLSFWDHYGGVLRDLFPENLAGVTNDDIFRAINRVRPSLRRLDADECTYNLHIIIRFEIELGLIEGDVTVDDVPALWASKMKTYLGLDVPDDAQGCLQDVHWSHGAFGYFPTYTLGNLYAAQLFEQLQQDIPDLWNQVGQGDFSSLLGWLREHIHRIGRRKLPAEIVRDATGAEPSSEPYLRYLETKYTKLYDL